MIWVLLVLGLVACGAWFYFKRKPAPKIHKRPAPLILPASNVTPEVSVIRPPVSTRAQGHRKSVILASAPILMQGELRKRDEKPFAGRFQWRKRWFVVQNGYLKYYSEEAEQPSAPLKAFDLRQIKDIQTTLKGFSFRVVQRGSADRVFSLKPLLADRHRIPEWVSALSPTPITAETPAVPLDTYDPLREYLSLAPSEVTRLAEFQNDGTWTSLFSQDEGQNNCVSSFKKVVNAEGLTQYLSFGKFPYPAATVFKVMQDDFDYLKVWEKNTLDVSVLGQRSLPGGDIHSLIHWIVKWPTFFKNREYLYVRRTRSQIEADGTRVFAIECGVPACLKTDDTTKLPASYHPTDAVRVTTYEALTVLRETGPNSCTFVFKCIDDPKVVLPKALMAWVVDHALPSYMKTMRRAIREYDGYVANRKPTS